MRALLVCALAVLGAGCPLPDPDYPYNREPDPRKSEITLGPGDLLEINVWENKDLTSETRIRPDGFITMPLVGDLKATGQTPSSLKATIKSKLQEFIKTDTTPISVKVTEWKAYKFTVQGEVVRQGVFQPDSFVKVSEALAMAGGLTRFAKRNDVRIFRTDPKTRKLRQIPIVYDALTTGQRLDMDIWILPGDVISAP